MMLRIRLMQSVISDFASLIAGSAQNQEMSDAGMLHLPA